MGLLSFLLVRTSGKQLSALAQEVAQNSHVAVWQRVHARAATMRLVEARGYVRARAAQVIAAEMEHVLQARPAMNDADRAELTRLATNAVISSVARDLLHLPAPYTLRRRQAA